MRRIVSKIDYDMKRLGDVNPDLAVELWNKIKNKSSIINSSIKVIELENGKKSFYAPAICHMILSNPNDVEEKLYENLVLTILKDNDLNRLTVFNNMSFLYLILLSGKEITEEFNLNLIKTALKTKSYSNPYTLRYVNYDEIENKGEKVLEFKFDSYNVSLTDEEMNSFSKREYVSIDSDECYHEIDSLYELAQSNLNPNLEEPINYIYNYSKTYRKNK